MPELALSRREVLAEAAAMLGRAGFAEPRREALRLWAEIAPGAGEALVLEPHQPADAADRDCLRELINRRVAGEPFAYVVGRSGFRRLMLRSDRRALIPRPETEGLVDLLLAKVRSGRAADIGTGTGCLALSLATEADFDQVIATDLSREAIALAEENRRELAAETRVKLLLGDLCAPLADASLDALVSNPPYLTSAEYAALDPAVRHWEPGSALESGADGMAATLRLLTEAGRVLKPDGWIALEVDCTRAGATAVQARELGWSDVTVETDLFGRERYLLARRSAAT